jgi:hypothetical protein
MPKVEDSIFYDNDSLYLTSSDTAELKSRRSDSDVVVGTHHLGVHLQFRHH